MEMCMESEKSRPLVARWRDAVLSAYGPPKPMTRLVLVGLAKYMNRTGDNCWPSIEIIADDTGLARRSVLRHIAEARDSGWISVRTRGANGQGWRRHAYAPAFPPGDTVAPRQEEGGATDAPRTAEGGANECTKVVPLSPKRGAPVALEQEREQEREQEGAAQGGRRRSRAAHLPKSFEPDSTCRAKAEMLGLDLGAELETFTNHAQAHGRTVKDWQAAFRNWLIKANQFGRGQQNTKPSQRRVSPSDHFIDSYD